MDRLDVGALVKSCREFSQLTQEDVVNLVKIPLTQPELSAIESGKTKKVSFEKVYGIIAAMGLDFMIHEGSVINDITDVRKLREEFGVTVKSLAKEVGIHEVTLSRQERDGGIRLADFLIYLSAMDLKVVLVDSGIDVNNFKDGAEERTE